MDITQDIRVKAASALEFLNNHPALTCMHFGGLFDNLWFSMVPCCKRGYSKCEPKEESLHVYRDDPEWNQFAEKFPDRIELFEEGKESKFDQIYLTYEEKFGEPWVFDHIGYWYELSIIVFDGDLNKPDLYPHNWRKFGTDIEDGAASFEEMLIDIATKVAYCFGDYVLGDNRLLTSEEIQNHDEHEKYLTGVTDPLIQPNPKYIHIDDNVINRRWLKWYITTEHFKTHHMDELEQIANS